MQKSPYTKLKIGRPHSCQYFEQRLEATGCAAIIKHSIQKKTIPKNSGMLIYKRLY